RKGQFKPHSRSVPAETSSPKAQPVPPCTLGENTVRWLERRMEAPALALPCDHGSASWPTQEGAEMTTKFTRRRVLKAVPAAVAGAALPAPFIAGSTRAASADPILIGVPTAQTAQAGVADHQDYLNGTTLAIEEINAAGGVLGRQLKTVVVDIDPLSPESGQVAVNKLIDAKVHAMSCAFVFTPVPVADVSARYKAPFLWGLT